MSSVNGPGIAAHAFKSAQTRLSLSSDAKTFLDGKSTIGDVQRAIYSSFVEYQSRVDSTGKTRKWLQRASETICHYSSILDIFVQHHPEYVALVWGTMRLLFTSVVNHGQSIKVVAKSITTVAQTLPNVQKLSTLYPSTEMQLAVENLYSNILEFLLKAHSWINESKFKHIYHSITRPPELEYGDIFGKIADWSKYISDLSNVESQVQARQVNEEHKNRLQDISQGLNTAREEGSAQFRALELLCKQNSVQLGHLFSLLNVEGPTNNDVLARMEVMHAIQTSAQLNTNIILSEVHRLQVLSNMSHSYGDPDEQLRKHVIDRNRRFAAKGGRSTTNAFWSSPRLQKRGASNTSSLITIRGPLSTKAGIQDFGIDVLQALQVEQPTVIWALQESKDDKSRTCRTATNLLKYLTWQARRSSRTPETEKDLSVFCAQLKTSYVTDQVVAMFRESLSGLGKHIHLVIDLATVQASSGDDEHASSLVCALNQLIEESSMLRIKIILLAYDAQWSSQILQHAPGSIIQVSPVKPKAMPNRKMQQIALRRKFAAR